MKKPISKRFAVILLSMCLAETSFSQTPFAFSCADDEHISAGTRDSVDSVAQHFAERLLGQDPALAYDMMSDAGKQQVTREQLSAQMAALVQQFEPTNLQVQHTYLIDIKGKSPGRVVCATDSSKSTEWESLSATDVPEQAHVLLSADTRNNKIVFAVWLVSEQGAWKVQSIWMNVATLADKGSEQLLELARAQKKKDHMFNAALLYAAAGQTANRGPNIQLGVANDIAEEASQLSLPIELQGQPPFTWKTPDGTFQVMNVGPIAVGGKIYVMIQHEAPAWPNDKAADELNKKLLAYFKGRFPEYTDLFSGVVVRVHERGGSHGYGTVEDLSTQAK
ncbi:MAG TPA: hypothetical protein VME23_04150 [Terracidiphilus sp.]|nr:hypothetical protein [Terracidiphilus sp.]